jgi:transposase
MKEEEAIKRRYELVARDLNERTRRLLAASEALAIGRGGISAVSRATGLSRKVISLGIKDLQDEERVSEGRIRRRGGGRKTTVSKDPNLQEDLERLVEPVTRGDPESPLRWTVKSVRTLAQELKKLGHQVSHQLVSELLHTLGYSLQANRKTHEGGEHPDRDAQFEHINTQAKAFLAEGEPVISVDAKKKELVGDFKNPGREWHPKGESDLVRVYDFPIEGQGRVTPYGVYDQGRNIGWVNVGIDHDTAEFAVESIRRWWNEVGQDLYSEAARLLITADGGGSNGSRVRLWKWELQRLADETGLEITVCHFPPGTSKWNKIEHRLFSFISQNWRGKPLVSYEVIIKLIAATRTRAGLTVQSRLDTNTYQTSRKIADSQMDALLIRRDNFHGEWNYTILPRTA